MNRETRQAIGVVGVLLLLIAGAAWFFLGAGQSDVAVEELPLSEIESTPVPEYQEFDKQPLDSDQDDSAHDVTRIIIIDNVNEGEVNVEEVLTGKVIVDDLYTQEQPVSTVQ